MGRIHLRPIFLYPLPHTNPTLIFSLTRIPRISQISVDSVKYHGGSPLVYSNGSHGFNEIQQEDYLWKFVLIRGLALKSQISRITRIFFGGICGFVESC